MCDQMQEKLHAVRVILAVLSVVISAVVSGCAHEENARRFIDFAIGADAQSYMQGACMRRPVRTDLLQVGEEGLVLMDYDLDRAAAERETILERWRTLEDAA